MKKDNHEEAEPLIRDALEIRNNALPEDHAEVIEVKNMLGSCLVNLGQYNEAESYLLDAHTTLEQEPGIDKELRKNTLEHLILLYDDWDQPEKVNLYQAVLDNL